MKSQPNIKQRDRVASYAGGMLNRANSSGSSTQTNQKKKAYRARGCRGGTSRKNRNTKKPTFNHSNQNEENDPSRVNNNSEKHSYNAGPREGSQPHKLADKRETNLERSSDRLEINQPGAQVHSHNHNKTRTLSILPNVPDNSIQSVDRPAVNVSNANDSCGPNPILPGALQESAIHSTNRGLKAPSVIARPSSSTGRSDAREGSFAGGFSFFCISPRSFLSGQKKAKSKRLY